MSSFLFRQCVQRRRGGVASLRVETSPRRDPRPGEVRVRMCFAPIDPADLNILDGTYGIQPAPPFVPGLEGAGVVDAVGGRVKGFRPGDRVILPGRFGSWTEFVWVSPKTLVKCPDGISLEQAAMLSVNPPTAYWLLSEFVRLKKGDWIIQNAATSGVGRWVILFARARGWRTVNVVRDLSRAGDLKKLGADAVVPFARGLHRRVGTLTAGASVRLGINAVGGENAAETAKALSPGGALVTIGAMAREPLRIANRLLIFRDIAFRGFWLREKLRKTSRGALTAVFRPVFRLARARGAVVPVEKIYPIEEVSAALDHARRKDRRGKILLKL